MEIFECRYVPIYIYIYIERERDIHTHTHTHRTGNNHICTFIQIYWQL